MFNIPRNLTLDYLKNNYVNKNVKVGDILRVDFNKLQLFSTEKSTLMKLYSKLFLGLCVRRTNKFLASRITIRNVIHRQPLETTFFLNSPFLFYIKKYKQKKGLYRSARLLFLRKRALHYSRVKLKIRKK
jgi:ribosomal protein L19